MFEEEGVDIVLQPSENANDAYPNTPTLHRRGAAYVHHPNPNEESKQVETAQTEHTFQKKKTCLAIVFSIILASVGIGVVAARKKSVTMSSTATFAVGCSECNTVRGKTVSAMNFGGVQTMEYIANLFRLLSHFLVFSLRPL
jgi:hypothetical protein